jgi:bis(5'-nucleosyl)-tetraphosphatase (symmetrical)
MTTFAVGDIQGCYDELQELLDLIKFDFRRDTLWLTGDLVNRGPRSLDVLRFIKSLGECAVTVLGNHDLHLLAVAYGHEPSKKGDTLDDILQADDKDELLLWLRNRPLLFHDEIRKLTLIHGGLAPQWSLNDAISCAREVEQVLSGDGFNGFLANMYGNLPVLWSKKLKGWDRLRFITNSFTRLRYVNHNGELELKVKGSPSSQPDDYLPWFKVFKNNLPDGNILFGHWSTLGFSVNENTVCLDGGCVWGGKLTAINIDEVVSGGKVTPVSVVCPEKVKPSGAE